MPARKRELILPAPERPQWVAPVAEEGPLQYLGWGERDYHKRPLPMHRKIGWTYTLVRAGSVHLVLPEGETQLNAGTFIVASPDSLFGYRNDKGETCDLRIWLWQAPPTIDRLIPTPHEHRLLHLDTDSVQFIEDAHASTRQEITHPDRWTPDMFDGLRRRIDITLARLWTQNSARASDDQRIELAQKWIRANLAVRNPVALLCDYLQVSPNTLHKLFRKHTGVSPGAYHQQLKLREAQRLIGQEGWLVKQAAYHLGYRHPNDLSRAMSKL